LRKKGRERERRGGKRKRGREVDEELDYIKKSSAV
jgi:hypothetical protein